MPKISISKEHQLNQSDVTRFLKLKIAAALQENAGSVRDYHDRWTDDNTMEFAFKTMGAGISGLLRSLPNRVTVEVTLPFAALMVKGMIETRLNEELGKILAEAVVSQSKPHLE